MVGPIVSLKDAEWNSEMLSTVAHNIPVCWDVILLMLGTDVVVVMGSRISVGSSHSLF